MKIKYIAHVKDFYGLKPGKCYEVISQYGSWYRIIDESGEDYLYPPELFEIVDDSVIATSENPK